MPRWPRKDQANEQPQTTEEQAQEAVLKEDPAPVKATPQKPVLEPLHPGQKYFEAPDGTIIIGESDRDRVWYRQGNGGKGCWINPKR